MAVTRTKSELARYEKERKEGFNRIFIGGSSPNGKKIYDVYAKGDDYAIYAIDSDRTIKN